MSRYLTALGIVVVVAAGWMLVLPSAPLAQPIAFNHEKHQGMGCAACHQGVETSERAGIPQGDLCLGCHGTAPPGVSSALWEHLEEGGQIDWVRVTRVPDHAVFSHRRHVRAGLLRCESCHGDIGTRATPPGSVPVLLTMDTCMSCHTREGASEDCAACHR